MLISNLIIVICHSMNDVFCLRKTEVKLGLGRKQAKVSFIRYSHTIFLHSLTPSDLVNSKQGHP